MKITSAAELRFKTNAQLTAMIQAAIESLRYIDCADPAYAATVTSINIIKRVLASRRPCGPRL